MNKILLLLFVVSTSLADDSSVDLITNLLGEAYKIEDSEEDSSTKSKNFKTLYVKKVRNFLDNKPCKTLQNAELKAVINLMTTLSFYVQSDEIAVNFEQCVMEADSRKISTPTMLKYLYKGLINSRMFSKAKKLTEEHPILGFNPITPEIKNLNLKSDTAIVYEYDQSSKSLLKTPFKFAKGKEVIVIAAPNCHFCLNAVKDIKTKKRILDVLSQKSRWLIPPDGSVHLKQAIQWNINNPKLNMSLIDNFDYFPNEDYWGTPTFYFLENGKIIDKLSGWPKDKSNLEKLSNKLAKHFPTLYRKATRRTN